MVEKERVNIHVKTIKQSHGSIEQPDNQSIDWLIDNLPAGKSRTLRIEVKVDKKERISSMLTIDNKRHIIHMEVKDD